MSDQLKNVDLPGDSLNIAHVKDLLLFEYFYGHLLLSQVRVAQLHLTESALSYGFAQNVVAHILELALT